MKTIKHAVVSSLAVLAMATCAFAQPDIPVNPNPAPEEIPAPRLGRYDAVESIEVSPDGKWLATTHLTWQYRPEDRTRVGSHARLHVWDVATGELTWTDAQEEFLNLTASFSPDSSRLLLSKTVIKPGAGHVTEAQLRDSGSGNIVTTLKGGSPGRDGHFTANGKQLVFPMSTGLLWLWDTASGEVLPPIAGLLEKEKIVGFSKDGTRILTSYIETEKVWVKQSKLTVRSWPDLKALHELPLETTWPHYTVFAPDGKRAAFVHRLSDTIFKVLDYEVVVWEPESQKLQSMVLPTPWHSYGVDALFFMPDGKTILGSGRAYAARQKSGAEFWNWNIESGELLNTFNVDRVFGKDVVSSNQLRLKFHPDGKSVFIDNGNNQAEQRLLADGSLIRSFEERKEQ